MSSKKFKTLLYSLRCMFRRRYTSYVSEGRRLSSSGYDLDDVPSITIYAEPSRVSLRSYVKFHDWVHNILKARVVLPLIHLFDFLFGSKLVKDSSQIPDLYQFRNLRLFDLAFDRTCLKWEEYFHVQYPDIQSRLRLDWRFLLNCHKNFKPELGLLKRIYLTITKNDTAYLEFHNILMFELASVMNEYYENKPHEHILYTAHHINDIRYFLITGDILPEHQSLIDFMLKTGQVYLSEVQLHACTLDHYEHLFNSIHNLSLIPNPIPDPTLIKFDSCTDLSLLDILSFNRLKR